MKGWNLLIRRNLKNDKQKDVASTCIWLIQWSTNSGDSFSNRILEFISFKNTNILVNYRVGKRENKMNRNKIKYIIKLKFLTKLASVFLFAKGLVSKYK